MIGAKKTTSSRLRHKLTLQQEVQTPDGAGGSVRSWQNVADLWAEIIPIGGSSSKLNLSAGKEVMVGGQVQAEVSHRILLRYRDGVLPSMRLVFESRIFNIRSVANIEERREKLELLVQEGVGN